MVGTRSGQIAKDRTSRLRNSQIDKNYRDDSSASPSRVSRTRNSKKSL